MVMPPSRINPPLGLKAATVTIAFIFLLTFLSLRTVVSAVEEEESLVKMKMVLGSKPPGCVNKCLSCRPCKATLVIPPSHHQKIKKGFRASPSSSSSHDEDDTYYLLSWKCKCGNKLFQP